MRFYVPSIGDQIRLIEDWEFPLFTEDRNDKLLTRIQPGLSYGWGESRSILAILEAGTVLQIDRMTRSMRAYIRKGNSEWDSITFWIKFAPNDKDRDKVVQRGGRRWHHQSDPGDNPEPTRQQKFKGARFWAKLEDVNEIVCDKVSESERVK